MTKPQRDRGTVGAQPHRVAKQRQLIAVALLRSITEAGVTNAAAARWLGIAERTMFAWVHCERPVSVETVLACKQLSKAFREALCTYEHGAGSVPYVAKKRGAR